MMMLFLIGPPLVAASVAVAVRPYRTWVGWVNVIAAGLSLAVSLAAALAIATGVPPALAGAAAAARFDALSALLAVCIAFVMLLASSLGPGLADQRDDPSARTFRVFINLFVATMLTAVTVQNVALM